MQDAGKNIIYCKMILFQWIEFCIVKCKWKIIRRHGFSAIYMYTCIVYIQYIYIFADKLVLHGQWHGATSSAFDIKIRSVVILALNMHISDNKLSLAN